MERVTLVRSLETKGKVVHFLEPSAKREGVVFFRFLSFVTKKNLVLSLNTSVPFDHWVLASLSVYVSYYRRPSRRRRRSLPSPGVYPGTSVTVSDPDRRLPPEGLQTRRPTESKYPRERSSWWFKDTTSALFLGEDTPLPSLPLTPKSIAKEGCLGETFPFRKWSCRLDPPPF